MQDSNEEHIEAINEKMLHGPVDKLYVVMNGFHDPLTEVPLSGS